MRTINAFEDKYVISISSKYFSTAVLVFICFSARSLALLGFGFLGETSLLLHVAQTGRPEAGEVAESNAFDVAGNEGLECHVIVPLEQNEEHSVKSLLVNAQPYYDKPHPTTVTVKQTTKNP